LIFIRQNITGDDLLMKKLFALLCVVLVITFMPACGEKPTGSVANYTNVLQNARPAELNGVDLYNVVTKSGDKQYNYVFFPTSPFIEEDMQRYAISCPGIITLAYCVAVILPEEGKEQAVLDAVNEFVLQNQKAQSNYIPEQYEIAQNAQIKVAKTGEVLLAMCENSEDVMQKLESGLAQ
jgi:hypothetical protein